MEYFNVSTGNNNSKRNAGMFCERIYTNNKEKRYFIFHKMEVMNRFFPTEEYTQTYFIS